jgi:hypothetical protein
MTDRQLREQEVQIACYQFLSREVTDPLAACLLRVVIEELEADLRRDRDIDQNCLARAHRLHLFPGAAKLDYPSAPTGSTRRVHCALRYPRAQFADALWRCRDRAIHSTAHQTDARWTRDRQDHLEWGDVRRW